MSDYEINADLIEATESAFAAFKGHPAKRDVDGDISVDDGRLRIAIDLSTDCLNYDNAFAVVNELESQFCVLMHGVRNELTQIARRHAICGRTE